MIFSTSHKSRNDFRTDLAIPGTGKRYYEPAEDFPGLDLVCGAPPSPTIVDIKTFSMDVTRPIANTEQYCLMATRYGAVDNCEISLTLAFTPPGDFSTGSFLAAKGTDENNFVGIIINDGLKITQRVGGTYTELVSAPLPNPGDKLTMKIIEDEVTLLLNDVEVGSATTSVPRTGYVGIMIRQHPVAEKLFDYWDAWGRKVGNEEQVIPCNPQNQGWSLGESSYFDEPYKADKAFNCTISGGGDCWVCEENATMPQWLEATLDSDDKHFVPTRVTICGRDISDSHQNDRRPDPFVIQGSHDGVTWQEVARFVNTGPLNGSQQKSFVISTSKGFSKFRFVWENSPNPTTEGPAEIGWIKLFGYEIKGEMDIDTPKNCEASDGKNTTEIDITWDAGSPNEKNVDEYVIYRDGVEIDRVPKGTFTYTDTTAVNGKVCLYFIEAYNSDGYFSEPSNTDSGYTLPIPEKPGNFRAKNYMDYKTRLTWNGNNQNIVKYEIYRDGTKVDEISAPFTENVHLLDSSGLTPTQEYSYYMIGYTRFDDTATSDTTTAYYYPMPNGEFHPNWDFTYGLDHWVESYNYDGTAIDNGDGTVTLQSNSAFYSIESDYKNHGQAKWMFKIVITDITGNGKIAIRKPNLQWTDILYFDTPGTYYAFWEGDLFYTTLGANNDSTMVMTVDEFTLTQYKTNQTPKMTNNNNPRGFVRASRALSGYPAWEGMNGVVNKNNAWLTRTDAAPAIGWDNFDWLLRIEELQEGGDGQRLLFPYEMTMTPRGGMASSWYSPNNPYALRVVGLDYNDQETPDDLLLLDPMANQWTNGSARTWGLARQTYPLRGFRIYLKSYNFYQGNNTTNHTGFSNLVVKYYECAYDRT
jgi:hypothetical protein